MYYYTFTLQEKRSKNAMTITVREAGYDIAMEKALCAASLEYADCDLQMELISVVEDFENDK